MNKTMTIQNQLLATKFFAPTVSGAIISRPRLDALLDKALKQPFTLVSAPAGFGKTTLLSTWAQSLQADSFQLCWISLDEEDNDLLLFWTYVLTALDLQYPKRFQPVIQHLQSQPPPSLKSLLAALINLLAENTEQFVLILDDYQVITEEQVHTTLAYLLEHLPVQLHIILSTREKPPLQMPLLRARQQVLEVCTDHLRCTLEEIKAFFDKVIGTQLPDETIQQVMMRTEGWLVGLQLLGLSLPECADPTILLEELSGNQRYILDYLTQEVLGRQPQEVQTFLLSTSILEHLTTPLCDAVMQQTGSQHILEQLEQANLFVVALDTKRQWYRYHALFAEALRYRLQQTQPDLALVLHHRASLWYAQHDQTTEAILHAFNAHQWQWAADLVERIPLLSLAWGASQYTLAQLREWLQQLPTDIVGSRPRLCLACTQILWQVGPQPMLQSWLDIAEKTLTASLTIQAHQGASLTTPTSQERQELQNLLGEIIAWRALLQSYQEDGHTALVLCEQALASLSVDNFLVRSQVTQAQLAAYHASSANNAVVAIENALQAIALTQQAGEAALPLCIMGLTAYYMIEAGQLHEAYRLTQQATQLRRKSREAPIPDMGWPILFQAEILREWNMFNTPGSLSVEAISQFSPPESIVSLVYFVFKYAILVHIHLSYGELDAACSALQELERIGLYLNQPVYLHLYSLFTTVDQVRLWLARGELDRATRWAKELDLKERYGTLLAHEREEVACIRILLAEDQPDHALQRLDWVLQRATAGQRWGHVIEMQLLQALAHQMLQQQTQALDVLSKAVRLAEPEGYIRKFVDEGACMATLLSQLREQQCKDGPTSYLDTVLAAFPQQSKAQEQSPKLMPGRSTTAQSLLDPLSERELQVLQLLAQGASNLEIAQKLVIAVDTVKRHVSHIFAKLGVQNRIQTVRRAQDLGLLDEVF